jgi:hypothetical protein
MAEDTIGRLNRTVRDTIGAEIDPRKWEHLAPVATNLPEERLQDKLNHEVEHCEFFVLILYKRYGTIEVGQSVSNTEREVEAILKVHKRKPRRKIFAYFRELDANADPGEQETKVRDRTYREPHEFEQWLTHDLYDQLFRIHLSGFKQQQLMRFWRFGDTTSKVPRLAILYPPVERSNLPAGPEEGYWLNRLAPQMAFEDFKAIQKIERSLQLLRFDDYRIYPFVDAPPELEWMNRVWLCLPRNRLGIKALREHLRTRFALPVVKDRPAVIEWQLASGDRAEITSPMAEYLRRQRVIMNTSGEWHGQLNHIVAKDFAVIARLQRENAEEAESLWDYFLAGLRGLGTWGAAWFIDRRYKAFQGFDESDNIELLLQVTFRDGRILNVVDVSDEPAEFFDRENDANVIDDTIATYRE